MASSKFLCPEDRTRPQPYPNFRPVQGVVSGKNLAIFVYVSVNVLYP